jgi:hypothetical protein
MPLKKILCTFVRLLEISMHMDLRRMAQVMLNRERLSKSIKKQADINVQVSFPLLTRPAK